MPQDSLRHIRIRNPDQFSKFRVITKMSHLDEDDQKLVRKHVSKAKRSKAKFTVGKLKAGRKIKGRSWKLQKIMVKRKGGIKTTKKKTYKKKSTAKKHMRKGDSLYKVKGGWRISRK